LDAKKELDPTKPDLVDAYLLGPEVPVAEAHGLATAVAQRADDNEDKLSW
jgi:hypothetical protein